MQRRWFSWFIWRAEEEERVGHNNKAIGYISFVIKIIGLPEVTDTRGTYLAFLSRSPPSLSLADRISFPLLPLQFPSTTMHNTSCQTFLFQFALPIFPPRSKRSLYLSPSTYQGSPLPLRCPRVPLSISLFRTHQPLAAIPSAVFLPPDGVPPIFPDEDPLDDNDDYNDDDRDTNPDSTFSTEDTPPPSPTPTSRPPTQQFDSIDRLIKETSPSYETWADRYGRRSLSTYRGRSQQLLGADELNESLRPSFLQRHRHRLAPDEAFGAIFSWDAVVGNSRELEHMCWEAVAMEREWMPPDMDDIVRAEEMAPEAAVSRVFYWTQDWGEVKRCVFRKQQMFQEMEPRFKYVAKEGVEDWLKNMETYGVRCILCAAARTRKRAEEIVRKLGLGKYITRNDIVSNEDEFESVEQMLLMAALKAQRPPDKCVMFTDKPSGITAGHEVSAKVVALMGAHPAYEMKTADQIVSSFDELVVYNIRRLFSEEGMEFMDPQTELEHERQ